MSKMGRLVRRGNVYYHRASIPTDIKDTYPKSEETFSLKTRDYREAVKLVRVAAVEVDLKFEEHRRKIAGQRLAQQARAVVEAEQKAKARVKPEEKPKPKNSEQARPRAKECEAPKAKPQAKAVSSNPQDGDKKTEGEFNLKSLGNGNITSSHRFNDLPSIRMLLGDALRMPELTMDQINQIVHNFIVRDLNEFENWKIDRERPLTEQEIDRYFDNLDVCDFVIMEPVNSSDYTQFQHVAKDELKRIGLSLPTSSLSFKRLAWELTKAIQKVNRIKMDRLHGRYGDQYADPQYGSYLPMGEKKPKSKKPEVETTITMRKAVDKFTKHKVRTGAWNKGTIMDLNPKIELFLQVVGEKTLVSELTLPQVRRYANKVYGLSGKTTGSKITPKAIINHFSIIKALLTWLKGQGYGLRDGLKGVLVVEGKKRKHSSPIKAYTSQDLYKLFVESRWYAEDLINKRHPSKFWVPLLALFTGARLEEIAQLLTADIRQVEGIWCMDINNNLPPQAGKSRGLKKSVKTEAGERKIPLHPFLLDDLHFLDYVQGVDPNGRLWPELKLSTAKQKYSYAIGQWWSRLKKEAGFGNDKNFHSLRHTFTNCCKQSDIDRSKTKEVLGHEQQDITWGTYAEKYSVKILYADVISRIDFGVDLSSLKNSKFVKK